MGNINSFPFRSLTSMLEQSRRVLERLRFLAKYFYMLKLVSHVIEDPTWIILQHVQRTDNHKA